MPRQTVLLVGGTPSGHDEARAALDPALDLELLTGDSLEDVEHVFSNHAVDSVIVGAGVDPDTRVAILRHVLAVSDSTTVHVKDRDSGRDGMMPFANGVLTGLTWHQWSWSGAKTPEPGTDAPAGLTLPATGRRPGLLRRIWDYVFGRSEAPYHPPPPPHSPGAGGA